MIHQVEAWINAQPDYVDDLNITLSDNLDFTISRLVDRELFEKFHKNQRISNNLPL